MREYKDILRCLAIFAGLIVACRLSRGAAVLLLALYGAMKVTRNRPGVALLSFIYIPLLTQINPSILGRASYLSLASKLGIALLAFMSLLQAARRHGRFSLPIGILYIYLVIATFCSIGGWCPLISYLKVANFLVFLVGVHFATKNLNRYPTELKLVRDGILAFACFLVFGSIFSYFVPSIGYANAVRSEMMWGAQEAEAEVLANLMESGRMMLFAGVTNHSQVLSALMVAIYAWTLYDLIFIVRRVDKLHMAILAASPILLFMTRSRLGLLGFAVASALAVAFVMPKVRISPILKQRLKTSFLVLAILGAIGGIVAEVSNQSISRWLRKTDDLEIDNRELGEAITSSRLGLIDRNMYDFHKNPLLGMGFQTSEEHAYLYKQGAISFLSAPVEKGVLPTMVLGETGVVGAIVFTLFLLAFYSGCRKKGYVATAAGMTMILTLNMGEAGFFSPSGTGGMLWAILICGCFTLDMILIAQREQAALMAQLGLAEVLEPEPAPRFPRGRVRLRPRRLAILLTALLACGGAGADVLRAVDVTGPTNTDWVAFARAQKTVRTGGSVRFLWPDFPAASYAEVRRALWLAALHGITVQTNADPQTCRLMAGELERMRRRLRTPFDFHVGIRDVSTADRLIPLLVARQTPGLLLGAEESGSLSTVLRCHDREVTGEKTGVVFTSLAMAADFTQSCLTDDGLIFEGDGRIATDLFVRRFRDGTATVVNLTDRPRRDLLYRRRFSRQTFDLHPFDVVDLTGRDLPRLTRDCDETFASGLWKIEFEAGTPTRLVRADDLAPAVDEAYRGRLRYSTTALFPPGGADVFLHVESGGAETEVLVGGRSLGIRAWEPFEWPIPVDARGRSVRLEIRIEKRTLDGILQSAPRWHRL